MLGKLLKYEFKSYGFSMGIIFLAFSLVALFMKILSMLPYKENVSDGIQMLMVVGFVMVMFVTSIVVTVMTIVRFYSTTVSDQGYLTWTLPAKTSTILWSKLLGAILWKLICLCVIAVMCVIFFTGSYWLWHEEMSGAFFGGNGISLGMVLNEVFKDASDHITSEQITGFLVYYFSTFIWSISGILLIYMCIGVGQLFGKYRVVASIGCYFIIMIVVQIVSTIGVAIMSGISYSFNQSPDTFDLKYGLARGIGSVVLAVLSCTVLFLITNNLFKKHLNLD